MTTHMTNQPESPGGKTKNLPERVARPRRRGTWERRSDLNRRPAGYEPAALTGLSYRAILKNLVRVQTLLRYLVARRFRVYCSVHYLDCSVPRTFVGDVALPLAPTPLHLCLATKHPSLPMIWGRCRSMARLSGPCGQQSGLKTSFEKMFPVPAEGKLQYQ